KEQEETLTLAAAEVTDGVGHEVIGNVGYLTHGPDGSMLTAVGIAGASEGIQVQIKDNRYLTVQVSPREKTESFTVVLWQGKADQKAVFEELLEQATADFPDHDKGSPGRWKEKVLTKGQVSP